MTDVQQISKIEEVEATSLASELEKVPVFAGIAKEDLKCLGTVELIHADAGADLSDISKSHRGFWIMLHGEIRLQKRKEDGDLLLLSTITDGETFGEVPLLIGKPSHDAVITVLKPSSVVYLREELFWNLMFACPKVRTGVLGNMARRLQMYQAQELHREKLISLGTMAAGLMHELNNPGTAARRAASQMRENLSRLQQISLRMCSGEVMTQGQTECLRLLQEQALKPSKPTAMSSMEQADAEDELASWLEDHGIENSWKLAATLCTIGFNAQTLECAQHEFPGNTLSDPLNWMEALISSVQLVGTIEESVSRVTDLVSAVKKFAYEDKPQRHQLDVHDSIQSTLVILGHKFRQKELTIQKIFAPSVPALSTCGVGLSQVWTNLLDNAIDASPAKSTVTVRTWVEGEKVSVAIADQGPGIPEENRKLIFEPFFTTKPTGHGTGLGLDIVRHIVVDKFGGDIVLESAPGKTEFIIRLPLVS
ncbi:MAG TPA: ATP-binding protein [Acidobacteriaceae bacterium]|nr:ATP-binding protein [Acidobacteriaceae bacterium]